MICPECGNVVATKRNRCERCNMDLTTYRKMYLLSNKYYNEGLEKAKVRDLSGAILVLSKSLEMNKRNTNARNLLGLVFYEMGETVSALSEWVISKHFQAEDNDADEYMEALQSNPTKLDTLNQTIKKYNSALQSAKQGSPDLAIIQLKKVTSLNPHFVKALQLLALLYMKNGETDKAARCLTKASKIDVSNTTTLRYMNELGALSNPAREEGKSVTRDSVVKSSDAALFQGTTYKEDKPNIWAFVNLILGVAIGVGVLFYLIVPTVKSSYTNKYKNLEVEYTAELNKQTQNAASLEQTNKDLQDQITKLQEQVDGFEVVEYDDTIYDNLFKAVKLYLVELAKTDSKDMDYAKVAKALYKVKLDTLEKQAAIDLYNQIKEVTFVKAAATLFEDGHALYSSRKYEEALQDLELAYEYDPANVDVIYFIGRSYHQLSDYENATKYYNILTENYPDSGRAGEAKDRLAEID
jgi:tetratricopeptide (TPR) repeat protein